LHTQNRVVALFRDERKYRYLGDWIREGGNSNVEEELLSAWLAKCGYAPAKMSDGVARGAEPVPPATAASTGYHVDRTPGERRPP
jgi:hypothetical protein